MVDAIVSFVVKKLGDYLIREAIFFGEVGNEVESLKKDLEWMLCFMKDAEDKQVDNALTRQWVSDIQEIAYDSEDILDNFMVQFHDEENLNMPKGYEGETSKRRQGLISSIKKCSSMLRKPSCVCSKGKENVSLYRLGKEIEALKKRLSDVARRCEFYGLKDINNKREGESKVLGQFKQLRKTTSYAFEKDVVGFDDDSNKLLAKLLENQPQRFVISIWGTGGLGKTTLARKLYHNDQVKNKFQRCAWVSVSQDYKIEDLLRRIIKSFNFSDTIKVLEKMSEEDLKSYLLKSLQAYSYLLVIDDVWETIAWESLKTAFPDNNVSSRVIITTRKKVVAERTEERTYVHQLRFLREDESWQLFCMKTTRKVNEDKELESLGRDMVQKCGGLPLAIVVLGGLLSTKTPQQWRSVRDHIWRELRGDSIQIEYLLALSFNDLPYRFRLCFLYLGHFPEDYEISTLKLIRLWVAEGFIQQNEEIMEDVAYGNLIELINRSLVQIDKTRGEKVVTCRVHDLLRDLAIQKTKELNFFHIFEENKSSTGSSSIPSSRRQAVYSGVERYLQFPQHNTFLRSLIFFDIGQKDFLTLCTRFRLLRVLNLNSTYFEPTIPEEIGKLVHLKYLGLRGSGVRCLPPSILNLLRLQTLDLLGDSIPELPTEIWKLKELRHLTGLLYSQYLGLDNLTNLQTLKYINGKTWTKINPENLVNLRELGMTYFDNKEEKESIFDSIAKLKNLQSLLVHSDEIFFASLRSLSHCQYLVDLSLHGKIDKLPEEMKEVLPNLEWLWLEGSNLVNDPMPTLEKMLNLTLLHLCRSSYCGKKLVCTANGFPRLEILHLHLSDLEEWHVEERAMPMLSGLSITNNSKMIIPERLRSVPRPADSSCRLNFPEDWV